LLFNVTKNKKKRQQLGEKNNAVTAALVAHETVYQSLQVCLIWHNAGLRSRCLQAIVDSLQSGAEDFLHGASLTFMKLSAYPRRDPAPQSSPSPINVNNNISVEYRYERYLGYFYSPVADRACLLLPLQMMDSWQQIRPNFEVTMPLPAHIDGLNYDLPSCKIKALWLLSAVTCVLRKHITPVSASRGIICAAFLGRPDFLKPPGLKRLRVDIEYWARFAHQRGMHLRLPEKTFLCAKSAPARLVRLVQWALFPKSDHADLAEEWAKVVVGSQEPVRVVIESLFLLGVEVEHCPPPPLITSGPPTPPPWPRPNTVASLNSFQREIDLELAERP
jgi:hypothetical protein